MYPRFASPSSVHDLFSWTESRNLKFHAGQPVVTIDGRVVGIVIKPSYRGVDGEHRPVVVPLSPLLIDKIAGRWRNQSSDLVVKPKEPVAGQEMSFQLQTQPGQILRLVHLNPKGEEVAWVFPDGSTRKDHGARVNDKIRRADSSGAVSWTRPGALHFSGKWALRAVFDPLTDTPDTVDFAYTLTDMKVAGKYRIRIGIEMNGISNGDFTTYFSDSVPTAMALDVSSAL